MRIYWLLFVALIVLACSDRELPVQTTQSSQPVLQVHQIPSFVNPGKSFFVSVKVEDEQGPQDIVSVTLTISRQGEATPLFTFELYDDGGAVHPDDGDVVAHDGIFSQKINWTPDGSARQKYAFTFVAIDKANLSSEPLLVTVVSLNNIPPEIINISMPDSLPSGFDGELLFEVTAIDSNGVDDLKQMTFRGVRNDTVFMTGELYDDGTHGDRVAGDGTFTLSVDRTFAAGKKGEYTLEFRAVDQSDMQSEAATKKIVIGNDAPVLSDLQAPTEVQIPASGNVERLITVRVDDPQGLGDIKFVGFMSLKPDSTYANGGLPIPMVDNGLPLDLGRWSQQYFGDQVAGDGIYSITAIIQSTAETGNYIWTFYAVDFVGNESKKITHVITLKK